MPAGYELNYNARLGIASKVIEGNITGNRNKLILLNLPNIRREIWRFLIDFHAYPEKTK